MSRKCQESVMSKKCQDFDFQNTPDKKQIYRYFENHNYSVVGIFSVIMERFSDVIPAPGIIIILPSAYFIN